MTYTGAALVGVAFAVVCDLWLLRTRLLGRKLFWVSYAIIIVFQLLTNGVLTGFGVVRYAGDAIVGETSPETGAPPFLGGGRIAFAPIEDLLFGFCLVLLTLSLWVWAGRRGIQRTPYAGPPRRWFPGGSRAEQAPRSPGPLPGRDGNGEASG